jgi:chromosome partitioning protein
MGGARVDEILAPSVMEGLTVLPSAPILASAEVELANVGDREFILRKVLGRTNDERRTTEDDTPSATGDRRFANRDSFDHILIDCPPSLGMLTVNALTAADFVVVPVQCEYLALEGLAQLMQTIALVRENLNPDLKLFGLVMTMFDPRGRLATQVIQEVRTHFPNELFETLIPRNVRVAEAPSFGQPLLQYDIHSRGAEAYEKLTNEFLMREARVAGSRWQVADSELPIANRGTQMADSSNHDNAPSLDGDPPSAIRDMPSAFSDEASAMGYRPFAISEESI